MDDIIISGSIAAGAIVKATAAAAAATLTNVAAERQKDKMRRKKKKKSEKKRMQRGSKRLGEALRHNTLLAPTAANKRRTASRKETWAQLTQKHPFQTVSSDHAETPRDAYVDITPFLRACATALSRTPSTVRLYDPYYCAGSVVSHLNALGFAKVLNRNIDCYSTPPPPHDVLVTNPPYSGDHLDKIVHICAQRDESFALLVPTYVIGKVPWQTAVETLSPKPFYVAPHRRYLYHPPAWATVLPPSHQISGAAAGSTRTGATGQGHGGKVGEGGGGGGRRGVQGATPPVAVEPTSPFDTIWCCWAPEHVHKACRREKWPAHRVSVYWSLKSVPSEHRDVTDPAKGKRPNPRARKRLAAIKRARAALYNGSGSGDQSNSLGGVDSSSSRDNANVIGRRYTSGKGGIGSSGDGGGGGGGGGGSGGHHRRKRRY